MSSALRFIWVKNVYRQYYNWFKLSATSSPIVIYKIGMVYKNNVKPLVVQQVTQWLNKLISTVKNNVFNLLNKLYTHYPQSLLLEPIRIN